MAFARIFETAEFGQILVKLGEHENGAPEIRWYAKPPMLGVSEFATLYEDSDEGLKVAERVFSCVDEEMAIQAASAMWSVARKLLPSLVGE